MRQQWFQVRRGIRDMVLVGRLSDVLQRAGGYRFGVVGEKYQPGKPGPYTWLATFYCDGMMDRQAYAATPMRAICCAALSVAVG